MATFQRDIPQRAGWGVLLSVIVYVLVQQQFILVNRLPLFNDQHTDNEMIAEYSVELLKAGQNPYTFNFTDMLRVNRDSISFTPWLDGSPQFRYTYPIFPSLLLLAFDFLAPLDFREAGLVRSFIVFNHLVLLTVVYLCLPRKVAALALVVFALLDIVRVQSMFGTQDMVSSLLLVLMILGWRRPIVRAVLFGLASTYRQQPWFIGPFLLVLLSAEAEDLRTYLRVVARFLVISIGTVLAINLPFILWGPLHWLEGALEPLYADFDVQSEGISLLWRYSLLNVPKSFFTVLQYSIYAWFLALYIIYRRWAGQAFWMIPALFFWFYYRSLSNYWLYWVPPLLVATFTTTLPRWDNIPRRGPWPFIIATAILLTVNSASAAAWVRLQPALTATVQTPLGLHVWDTPLIRQLTLDLTNHSNAPLTPRFAVQRDRNLLARPWATLVGPLTLAPGESGTYTIDARDVFHSMLPVAEGGAVVITDANGNYALRTVLAIPPDPRYAPHTPVTYTDFGYKVGEQPANWRINATRAVPIIYTYETIASGTAVRINFPRRDDLTTLFLARRFPMSDTLTLWVDRPPDKQSGVIIADGLHQIWVRFGDEPFINRVGHFGYIVHPVPAEGWQAVSLDIADMYKQLEYTPPQVCRLNNCGGHHLPLIEITLFTSGTAGFGPLTLPSSPDTPDNALRFPDQYALWHGRVLRQQGDLTAANRVLSGVTPPTADTAYELTLIYIALQDYSRASSSLETAIESGYPLTPRIALWRGLLAYCQVASCQWDGIDDNRQP
jgi:hypothetical protein